MYKRQEFGGRHVYFYHRFKQSEKPAQCGSYPLQMSYLRGRASNLSRSVNESKPDCGDLEGFGRHDQTWVSQVF